jgi:hypothetical protein
MLKVIGALEVFTQPERVSWEVDIFALGMSRHFVLRERERVGGGGVNLRCTALRRGESVLGGEE